MYPPIIPLLRLSLAPFVPLKSSVLLHPCRTRSTQRSSRSTKRPNAVGLQALDVALATANGLLTLVLCNSGCGSAASASRDAAPVAPG